MHANRLTLADALFLACTNLRSLKVIERLEAELGIPVVSSNQATLWVGLEALEVGGSGVKAGHLFRLDPTAPRRQVA